MKGNIHLDFLSYKHRDIYNVLCISHLLISQGHHALFLSSPLSKVILKGIAKAAIKCLKQKGEKVDGKFLSLIYYEFGNGLQSNAQASSAISLLLM